MVAKHPLLKYRETKKLSRERLAHQLGVSWITVRRWEKGTMPPRRRWKTIHDETGLNPEQFIRHAEASE